MFSRWPVAACVAALGCALGAGCGARSAPVNNVFAMAERVQVGSLVYRITDTEWKEQLGEGAAARLPRNRFLLVKLSVTNSGAVSSAIPGLKLIGAGGKTYEELSDAPGVPEWFGYLRQVKPAQTEHGRVVFDAPPGSYRLELADDGETEPAATALVDLPLQLGPADIGQN